MPPRNKAQDLFNVSGIVAVITGGGTGLGLYAARALDANGAKAVYILGRRESVLQSAAETAPNGSLIPLVCDVTSKDSLSSAADRIRKEQGHINFLFANAGAQGPKLREYLPKTIPKGQTPTIQELQSALWKPEMEDFTHASHVNCTAAFYTIVAFLDLLDAGTKKGNVPSDAQVLVTTSVAAVSRNLASGFAYSVSKAAVQHLAKMISTLCAQNRYRIRCNCIIPGIYPSEMTKGSMASLENFPGIAVDGEEGGEKYFSDASIISADKAPAERSGSEEDFAGAILFLASRAGAYINGETLLTDGGRLAQLPATY